MVIRSGRYRPIVELGRGGMASAWLAVAAGSAGMGRLIVLKTILEQLRGDPDIRDLFLDEARLALRLSHPHIVAAHEVFDEGDRVYLAMEYVAGKAWSRVIQRARASGVEIPLPVHLTVLRRLLSALGHLHLAEDMKGRPLKAVHRDVCPQNLMVSYDGQVKLMDFGVAHSSLSRARGRGMVGRVTYMAPEMADGWTVDGRADLFSAGLILWAALAGRSLWEGMERNAVLETLIGGGPLPPPSAVQPVAPALERICMRALASRPEDRYASADLMLQELNAAARQMGVEDGELGLRQMMGQLFSAEANALRTVIREGLVSAEAAEGEPAAPAVPIRREPPRRPPPSVQPAICQQLTEINDQLGLLGSMVVGSDMVIHGLAGQSDIAAEALLQELVAMARSARQLAVDNRLIFVRMEHLSLWWRTSPRGWVVGWGKAPIPTRSVWVASNVALLQLTRAERHTASMGPLPEVGLEPRQARPMKPEAETVEPGRLMLLAEAS